MVSIDNSSSKKLIVIAGPTAIGKTALSIKLAQHYSCPILSFDSRQFYTEMTIGTAKPSEKELTKTEHHFINSRSIHNLYTAGMFETDAIHQLNEIYKTNDICIAVGGSGLYINGLCYGIDNIPSDEKIREKLKNRWLKEGLIVLQEEVKKIDPEYYQIADIQNPRRIMRALEVYEISGKTYTSFRSKKKKERNFNSIWIGLKGEMEPLYERINQRVDEMLLEGLVEEVKTLLPFKELKALNTVGYTELFEYLEGHCDLEEAIRLIKRNSRRYAKRQLTWFRKNSDINWFNPTDFEKISQHIEANK